MAIVVVTGVALVGWLRPLRGQTPSPAPSKPTYTDQRVASAKSYVCAAFEVDAVNANDDARATIQRLCK